MARTISEIYDQLALEKEQFNSLKDLQPNYDSSQSLLEDVQSSSKVSEWRLWLWVVAFSQHLLEVVFDRFKTEVETLAESAKPHNLPWYRLRALEFQYGYQILWDEQLEKFVYPQDDPAARIIENAATGEDENKLIVKVAKNGIPLEPDEMTAFKSYFGQVKDAGTEVVYVSTNPDEFKIEIDVIYDPTVLNPDGSLILDPGVKPLELSIDAYLTKLPFNGALVLNKLVDELQNATGVVDPDLNVLETRPAGGVYVQVGRSYVPDSGYFAFDLANSVINYIPSDDQG